MEIINKTIKFLNKFMTPENLIDELIPQEAVQPAEETAETLEADTLTAETLTTEEVVEAGIPDADLEATTAGFMGTRVPEPAAEGEYKSIDQHV